AIDTVRAEASAAVKAEDYEAAMRAMAKLRPYVDAFFEKVTVNVADGTEKKELRENRLKLLNQIRVATEPVADFSCIGGGFSQPSTRFLVHLPPLRDTHDHHRCPHHAACCPHRRHSDPARAATVELRRRHLPDHRRPRWIERPLSLHPLIRRRRPAHLRPCVGARGGGH